MTTACKWPARIFGWLINLLGLAIVAAFIGAFILIRQNDKWGLVLLMPNFWAIIALYALYPLFFCLGLSLLKVAGASRWVFLFFGVPALLPWAAGLVFLTIQAPVIGPPMVAHATQMQKMVPLMQQLQQLKPPSQNKTPDTRAGGL